MALFGGRKKKEQEKVKEAFGDQIAQSVLEMVDSFLGDGDSSPFGPAHKEACSRMIAARRSWTVNPDRSVGYMGEVADNIVLDDDVVVAEVIGKVLICEFVVGAKRSGMTEQDTRRLAPAYMEETMFFVNKAMERIREGITGNSPK